MTEPENQVESLGNVQSEKTVEELKAELAAKEEMIELVKKAQQGQDQKNSHLSKKIEELQESLKERMTEKELKKLEDEQILRENKELSERIQTLEKNQKSRELRELKINVLKDNQINDLSLIDMLNGETIEVFQSNVLSWKDKFSNVEHEAKKDLMKGRTPEIGKSQTAKEMKRSTFNQLDPKEQRTAIKEFKIID